MERRDVLKAAGVTGAAGLTGFGIYGLTREESDNDTSSGPEPTPDGDTATPVETPDQSTRTPTDDGTPQSEDTQTTPDDDDQDDQSDEPASAYGTVVDAVEVGADPTGEEPVNFLFEEHADDDTVIRFEPGTYAIDYFSVSDLDTFGLVGSGTEPARFVPTAGNCRGGHPWVGFDGISGLQFENLTFDFRSVARGGPIHLFLSGDSTFRDVTCLGSCGNQISMLKVEVRDESGSAQFENLVTRNSDDNQSLTGVYVGRQHAGDVLLRDCTVVGFSDNGLYASAPGGDDGRNGAVRVVGGTYRNNNITGVRLGSNGSSAEKVTVIVDSETAGWGELNARGIRLRNKSGQLIDDCTVTFGADAANSFGGIVFHQANGGALVKNTTFTVDRDSIPAIRAFPVETPGDDAPTFENCTIGGDASDGVTARIEGRDGTVFRGCTIEQRGGGRKGLHFFDSEECRIVDSRIDVTTAPVAVDNGSVTIENSTLVTENGERQITQRTLKNETLRNTRSN